MPVPQDRTPAPRQLLRDVAYDTLHAAILDGTLAPGEKLQDAQLGDWLKLSRTPIREALARLEEDGLVETYPQRFTRVAPLDRTQARDAFQLVAAIHGLAARLAVPHVTNETIQRLKAANRDFKAALIAPDVDGAIGAGRACAGSRRCPRGRRGSRGTRHRPRWRRPRQGR